MTKYTEHVFGLESIIVLEVDTLSQLSFTKGAPILRYLAPPGKGTNRVRISGNLKRPLDIQYEQGL